VTSTQRLPQTDNNTTGLGSNLYGGPGFKHNVVNPPGAPTSFTRDNLGYQRYTPDEFFSETVNQDINRTISSGTFNYRPNSWLSVRAIGGIDFISRDDGDICIRDQCTYFGTSKLGFRTDARATFWDYTADVNSTASYRLTSQLRAKSTIGTQFVKEKFSRNSAQASDLAPGGVTVNSGANLSADETSSITSTLGFFAVLILERLAVFL